MSNPTDIHEQERLQIDKELKKRLERETEESDIKWLMAGKQGRRIVWRMLERSGVYRSTFNSDSMLMAFAEGNRNSGLMLMTQVTTLCPDEYAEMLRESKKHDDVD